MKIRPDFITNSSTSHYIIRNNTDTLKTMLDLMKEAATKTEWYLTHWPNNEKGRIQGNEYLEGTTHEGNPIPSKDRQIYLEKVERLAIFPPHVDVQIEVSWGFDAFYGDIFIQLGDGFDMDCKTFAIGRF